LRQKDSRHDNNQDSRSQKGMVGFSYFHRLFLTNKEDSLNNDRSYRREAAGSVRLQVSWMKKGE
jgi:hypothetical protein